MPRTTRPALLAALLLAASPSVPAQSPAASTSPEQTAMFQKLEDGWADALTRQDQYEMELILSPLFLAVASSGEVNTRNQEIASLVSKDSPIAGEQHRVILVRSLGEVAIVNGTYVRKLRGGHAPVEQRGVFTHVYQRGRAGWLCLNAQETAVTETALERARKKSDAELPFHIPLFYDGAQPRDTPAPGDAPGQPPRP